ncbi:YbbR-like domain-containing protein [Negadavirga shengliensis]|uniref:YbbR-like domain-containing protein n=1 Tax=Negadavirga shengliensis TaxID=1389218 RepID=A0ABV9T0G0_9BACT
MGTLRKYFKKLKPERTSNIKVVVLCVITATTFWVLNALNKDDYTTVVNQPIRFSYDRQEYMAVEELPPHVKIEIHGNGWDLLRKYFQFNVTPFVIELEDPSRQSYLLTASFQRELAERIAPTQLLGVFEDTVHFKIDKIVSRKIDLQVDTTATTLASNHAFGSDIKIDPPAVSVRGPISVIQQLEGRILVELGEENITADFSKLLPIQLGRDQRKFLTLEEETVHVEFEVIAFLEIEKWLKVNKVYFPANVRTEEEDSVVRVTYLVDERRLEDLEKLDLRAVLNFNNRNRGDSTVAVSLNANPAFIKEVRFDPDKFKLVYE